MSIKDENERKRDIYGKTVENSGGAQVGKICVINSMLQEFYEQGIPTHIAEITSRAAHGSEEELPPRNNERTLLMSLRTTRSSTLC